MYWHCGLDDAPDRYDGVEGSDWLVCYWEHADWMEVLPLYVTMADDQGLFKSKLY